MKQWWATYGLKTTGGLATKFQDYRIEKCVQISSHLCPHINILVTMRRCLLSHWHFLFHIVCNLNCKNMHFYIEFNKAIFILSERLMNIFVFLNLPLCGNHCSPMCCKGSKWLDTNACYQTSEICGWLQLINVFGCKVLAAEPKKGHINFHLVIKTLGKNYYMQVCMKELTLHFLACFL